MKTPKLGLLLPLTLLGFLCSGTAGLSQESEEQLRLVPFPKELRLQSARFRLGQPLIFEVPGAQSNILAHLLNEELARAGLEPAVIRPLKSPAPAFRLSARKGALTLPALPTASAPEGYALDVRAGEIVCTAKEPAGLFYGLQTLCQLLRANRQGDALPCLTIRDWPTLRWRCFQDDMTRGPSSTLATLKAEASLGASLKFNLMTYYMEYQYAFQKHPQIGPTNGSLTPGDLAALVQHGQSLHLDILGNQQSFGHFGAILKHPEFERLRETAGVLTPVHEETYRFLDELYSESCPLLPFPWFNVCCDETDGLGTGPSRELAAQVGVGGVYVRHIRRIHDLLRDKYQKRMMMWGDIILQHPDQLKEVPKDTIMLTWGYDARPSFEDQILPFAKSGYEFFVCPGVNNWSRILPDFGVAMTNIGNFVRDGAKHGAIGMINTDWEDDGEALNAVKWHADAWAAECAWNGSTTSPQLFNRRVGAVLFGEAGDDFGQAVELLSRAHRLPVMNGMFNARFWEKDFSPKSSPASIQSAATNLLASVRPALQHLEACRQQARDNHHVLEVFLFGARRMELIGQRMLEGLQAAQLYEQACQSSTASAELQRIEKLIRKNRDAHEALGRQFAALWLSESKPYALDWTLTRYTNAVNEYESLLRKLALAQKAALAGERLPAPEEVGLAIPRPPSRQVRASELRPDALSLEAPWAEPGATHRLGMVVQAGSDDRFDLPVELELALPAELVGKPVRAFLTEASSSPREVLAQLDAGRLPGKSRLILVLPGPLLKGAKAHVQLYLGLARTPPPLAGAVSTKAGPGGSRWIENDQVRLLLGAEGAHLYRWEVKAAGNRDLTMPGETGWAGFSDIHSFRGSTYRLNLLAHGPAMAECECTEATGHIRTLRLYGGASWVEVFLGQPTPVYWDYDNPKNFAADGPTPGTWLFSNGQSNAVGREADGVPAQVKASDVFWSVKFNADNKLALGLVSPEAAARHVIAPGGGAGGVGIENSPPINHFVTFGGVLPTSPAETMNRLQATLNLNRPAQVRLHSLQEKGTSGQPSKDLEFREGGIIRGPKSSRKLSLVFTGHGYAEGGETILNELTKQKAKASCFFTGAFLTNANFTALVQRLVKEGHYLGPHSDKHVLYCPWEGPKKTLVTQAEFASDLESNLKKIEAFGVKRPQVRYFLPPYEHYNQEIVDWSKELGLTLVNFTPGTRSAADYTGEAEKNFVSSKTIFESIVAKEQQDPNGLNGFILLLHIGSGPGRADKFPARFGELLDYLAGKGYQFVRIDELLDSSK